MKALSLWQPWATLVAIGAKRIETRSWGTTYRGPLAIHAAQRWSADQEAMTEEPPIRRALTARGYHPRLIRDRYESWGELLPRGRLVAVCTLVACIQVTSSAHVKYERHGGVTIPPHSPELDFGDYTPGRWAWVLDDIRPLANQVNWRGGRRLFDVPENVIAEAR